MMATETTFPSTSLQVGLHKISGNTLEHLGGRRNKARLLWLKRLSWSALRERPSTTTFKSPGKHSKYFSFANEKSMRLIEAIKRIHTSFKLNFLAVFVCLSLIESTAFANQPLQNDPQRQYQQHQHHQQIRRIFDHLESHKRQQSEQHLSQLASLVRSAEQQHQQGPPEEHLARQDGLTAEQPARGAFGQPLALSEEQPQSLWTNSDLYITPQTNSKQDQFNDYTRQQAGQYFAYRPLPALPANGPITTPPMSRQIMGPPQFYEFALSPTNAVQLEQISGEDREGSAPAAPIGAASLRANGAKSMANLNNQADNQPEGSNAIGVVARNPGQQVGLDQLNSNKEPSDSSPAKAQDEPSNGGNNAQDASSGGSGQEPAAAQQAVDKTIEPRQRRRIFNRILKKAEWNHLFVELSKVFLRYFLDLALKDIIGKQSGSTDTTTSRKKLDAQSELTDLLKDFVKTAISNI